MANHSVSVPSGRTVVYGGISSPSPAWLSALSVNQGVEFASTAIDALDPRDDPAVNPNHPSAAPWSGTSGHAAIMTAWCGAAYDSNRHRLMITGGGHGDYAGNEWYALNLNQDAPGIELWTEPSADVSDPSTGDGAYPDGLPGSVHNYAWLEYHPGADVIVRPMASTIYPDREDGGSVIWHFDCSVTTADKYQRALDAWSKSATSNPLSGSNRGTQSYNPNDGLLWVIRSEGPPVGLGTYNPATEAFTTVLSGIQTGIGVGTSPISCVASEYGSNGLFVVWRHASAGFYVFDLSNPTVTKGIPTFVNTSTLFGNAQPLAYDPVNHCIWTWKGGNTLGKLPIPADAINDTWTAESVTVTGATLPASPQGNGTFNRMRYGAIGGRGFVVFANTTTTNCFAVRVH